MKNNSINRTEVYEAWLDHLTRVSKMKRTEAATLAMEKALNALAPSVKEMDEDRQLAAEAFDRR